MSPVLVHCLVGAAEVCFDMMVRYAMAMTSAQAWNDAMSDSVRVYVEKESVWRKRMCCVLVV